jgi:XTP/dITP diphosphohydrolase
MSNQLRFLTKNPGKFGELEKLLDGSKYSLLQDDTEIHELQTENMDVLARDKALRAFQIIGRPLIIDHTGLQFDLLNGFPGGLTSVFYDKLKSEGISELIGNSKNRGVTAVTLIGYCDGRNIHTFRGEVRGVICLAPRGAGGFQWDTIFIPDGFSETFAELGDKKNEISMRRLAFDKFADFLRVAHAP